jgi:hypothetical protein
LAIGALGRSLFEEALEQKGRKPQEGMFRSSERDPALSGETAGAHPVCPRTVAGSSRDWTRTLSEDDRGLARDPTSTPCRRSWACSRLDAEKQDGKSARVAHVTRDVACERGQYPGEAPKLRRGSAIAQDVTIRRWYGFTVGARPWRRKRSEKRVSACGDGRPASTISLV